MKQRQNTSMASCSLVRKRATSPVGFSALPGSNEPANSRKPISAIESSDRFKAPVGASPCFGASGDQPLGAGAALKPLLPPSGGNEFGPIPGAALGSGS